MRARFSLRTLLLFVALVPLVVGTIQVFNGLWETTYVTSLTFSPDGSKLAAVVTGWQTTQNGFHLAQSNVRQMVGVIDLIRNNTRILYASAKRSGDRSRVDREVTGPAITFSPDGAAVAIAIRRQRPLLLNIGSGIESRQLASTQVLDCVSIMFLPDGRTIAIGTEDYVYFVRSRDLKEISKLKRLQVQGKSAAVAPDGETIAALDYDDKVVGLNPRTGLRNQVFQPAGFRSSGLASLSFSRDGKLLAEAFRYSPRGIRIWDVAKGKERFFCAMHEEPSYVCFDPSGDQVLAVGPFLGLVAIDLVTSNVQILDHRPWNVVAFSPNGKQFATGDTEGNITLWDRESMTEVRSFALVEPLNPVACILLFLAVILWVIAWRKPR